MWSNNLLQKVLSLIGWKKGFDNNPNLNISNDSEKNIVEQTNLCTFHKATYHAFQQWKDKNPII